MNLETPINMDSRLSIPPQVLSRQVGDETVLLDLASGQYFGLDKVGKRIWDSISGGRSLAETADSLVAEYEVGEEQASKDVIDFVTNLVDRGLLARGLPGE
jgi:hypothetical protein